MIPRVLLGTAPVPGGESLRLFQRGTEFSIMSGTTELMNSRLSGSEEALATLTAERLTAVSSPRVLIGGLGMGFTLRAALTAFGAACRIEVAEIVPAVIAWARGPMAALHGDSLDDARVRLHETDVDGLLAGKASWDAILLDVDNGPDGLTRAENDRLYSYAGLARARAALRPRGLLAVWSSGSDRSFTKRLTDSGFEVETLRIRARAGSGARHVIWMARARG